jgi:hypothetical protein
MSVLGTGVAGKSKRDPAIHGVGEIGSKTESIAWAEAEQERSSLNLGVVN